MTSAYEVLRPRDVAALTDAELHRLLALPSVDHFVAGHSLAAFEELVQVLTRA